MSGQLPLLLSFRSAAKALGVGRGVSLHALIAEGLIRPVKLLNREFIPREQIEALARGEATAPKARAPRQPKSKGSIADVVI